MIFLGEKNEISDFLGKEKWKKKEKKTTVNNELTDTLIICIKKYLINIIKKNGPLVAIFSITGNNSHTFDDDRN